ncbi:MAG: hypothetical protein JXR71_03885 [Bacteroidales bacterium]|nr:hypothetical protein [Bacteroidales bacterium]
MKKQAFLFLILLVTSSFAFSQTHTRSSFYNRGQKEINFGLGLNASGFPLYASVDFPVAPDVTVGPVVGITFGNPESFISMAGAVNYHFNQLLEIPSNWDLYAGGNIGFHLYMGNSTGTTPLQLGLQVGGRYFWNDDWGINLELGGGTGYGGLIGLTRKF